MSQQTVGFVEVEQLPTTGRHRSTLDDQEYRLVVVTSDNTCVAYRAAPTAADALWGWAIDMAHVLHKGDEEGINDLIDNLGIRAVSTSDLSTTFDLVDLNEGPSFHVETGE